MKNSDELRGRLVEASEAFAAEVVAMISRAAESMMMEMVEPGKAAKPAAPTRGRPRKQVGTKKAPAAPKEDGKRDLGRAITNLLKTKPEGLRAEQINSALGTESAQVNSEMQKLVTAGRVSKLGKARGTKYLLVKS